MTKFSKEWLKQAKYDLATAKTLFEGKRYIYSVFMCHLSIEKALKGIYLQNLKTPPPKIHNLLNLYDDIKLSLPPDLYDFMAELNRKSVPTRYPEDLQRMSKDYNKKTTAVTLQTTEALLKCLTKEYTK